MNHFAPTLCLSAILTLTIAAVSCTPEEPQTPPEPELETELNLLSDSQITVGPEGEECTIEYELVNPSDLQLLVKCDAEWIYGIDYSTTGKISFKVSGNTTTKPRETQVNVSYGKLSFSVAVTQEGLQSGINITSGDVIHADFTGGDFEILYEIVNPDPELRLSAKAGADWITLDMPEEGRIELHVDGNTLEEDRESVITLEYGEISETVTVKQDKKETGVYDEEFHALRLDGFYYGDSYSPGVGNYWFFLSDKGLGDWDQALPEGTFFRIDLYGAIAEDPDNARIPVGTYTLDVSPSPSCQAGTFSRANSGFFTTDADGVTTPMNVFDSATLTVSASGDEYMVELICQTSDDNLVRYVYYTGDVLLKNYAY